VIGFAIGLFIALVGGGVVLALLLAHATFTGFLYSPWARVSLGAFLLAIGAYYIARREQIATRARLARSQKGRSGVLLPPTAYVVMGIVCLLNGVLQLLMGALGAHVF